MKIYPTLVIRGTGLYELWKKGLYKNYPPERLVDLIARVLAIVPPWVRVYRIQRDIPMPLVTSGVEKGMHHQTCTHCISISIHSVYLHKGFRFKGIGKAVTAAQLQHASVVCGTAETMVGAGEVQLNDWSGIICQGSIHTMQCTAGNLRELALARMARLGLKCRDVRTREAGIQDIHHRVRPRDVELIRRDYVGSSGWETFLSYEDPQQDILIGLLRLRLLQGPDSDRQPGLSGAPMPS